MHNYIWKDTYFINYADTTNCTSNSNIILMCIKIQKQLKVVFKPHTYVCVGVNKYRLPME